MLGACSLAYRTPSPPAKGERRNTKGGRDGLAETEQVNNI